MLADALDGTLSAEEQAFFDLHMEHCGPCAQGLADARRGAAFLEMLRSPAPEPPASLLERILSQTSGVAPIAVLEAGALSHAQSGTAALAPGYGAAGVAGYANVVPFPRRFAASFRASSFGQIMLQPRLAMTAAMAFFSIALTMNLAGVHPTSLRPGDLKPSSLKREISSANTRVVQYYDSLRVVYELESRVHDLQNSEDVDATAGSHGTAPEGGQAPASQPGPTDKKAAPQPGSSKSPANPGSSRREDPIQDRRLVAFSDAGADLNTVNHALVGRNLV
jgi:hypothetical protein